MDLRRRDRSAPTIRACRAQRFIFTTINLKAIVDDELAEAGVQLAPGRLLSRARRVLAGDVTGTRAYREGRISIQDEAFAAGRVAGRSWARMILDCCAAPGSKTRLLARRNPRARVFATELHPHRARLLQSLNRLPNVHVVAADARHLPFARLL